MHSKTKNTEDSPSIVDEIKFINKNNMLSFSVLKYAGYPKEQTHYNYTCLCKENNQEISIPDSQCKRLLDLAQKEYDEQYADKKA